MSLMVKNPPVIWDTQVQPVGQEDPLKKGMAIHSSDFAWVAIIVASPWGCKEMDVTELLTHTYENASPTTEVSC